MRIPSHILYPGMILSLLGMSIVVGLVLVFAARSDGGAQVMPDYYEHAVEWDSEESIRRNSRALNLQIELQLPDDAPGKLTVRDRNGDPVEGLNGEVHLRRPQFAENLTTAKLIPDHETPGHYTFDDAPNYAPGYWDVVLDVDLNGHPLNLTHRQRLP